MHCAGLCSALALSRLVEVGKETDLEDDVCFVRSLRRFVGIIELGLICFSPRLNF